MKRLYPDTKDILKADLIINKARQELKDFIIFETIMIWYKLGKQTPNFGKDEEIVLYDSDLKENTSIKCIKISLDENVFIEVKDTIGEICWEDLGTDELVTIANVLQKTYITLIAEEK